MRSVSVLVSRLLKTANTVSQCAMMGDTYLGKFRSFYESFHPFCAHSFVAMSVVGMLLFRLTELLCPTLVLNNNFQMSHYKIQ